MCPYEDQLHMDHTAGGSELAAAAGSGLLHPNCKPLRVLLPLLHAYSRPGALVLDPFGGSGAHAHAALSSGRRVATMEISDMWARHIRDTLGAAVLHAASAASRKP